MSLTKRLLEQLEEDTARGFSVPERGKKYLCYKHYSDRYINQHIYESGVEGECSYCKSRCKVLDLSYFVEYVGAALSDYLVRTEDANLPYDSTFIEGGDDNSLFKSRCELAVPSDVDYYDDTDDVMSSFGLLSNSDELNLEMTASRPTTSALAVLRSMFRVCQPCWFIPSQPPQGGAINARAVSALRGTVDT